MMHSRTLYTLMVPVVLLATACSGTDTTAPSASIISPASGAPVSGTVSVQVTAADDQAVANVKLYARSRGSDAPGMSVGSTTKPGSVPIQWFTPNHPNLSELEIYAVATDFGANESRSEPVWVKVQNAGVLALQLVTAFTVPPSETAAPVSVGDSPLPVLPHSTPVVDVLLPEGVHASSLTPFNAASLAMATLATPERSLILEWQWSPCFGCGRLRRLPDCG